MSAETKSIFLAIFILIITAFLVGHNGKQKGELPETTIDTKEEVVEELIQEKQTTEELETDVEHVVVWTVANADIKKEPNINSEVVGNYHWNTEVTVTYIDDSWAKIKDSEQYISRTFISENPIGFTNYDVPSNNTIKSYMDYRCITSTISRQYKLQKSYAYTNDCGIRMVNGRYCIAVGSYYTTTIGQYIDVELENGSVIKAILADCKDDAHTDSTNRINPNGSVVEFVIDIDTLDYTAKIMGDISCVNDWNSKVVNIKVYDKVEEF